MARLRIAVLASGKGSNFRAIAQAIQNGHLENTEIVALVTNRANAGAVDVAREFQIPVHVFSTSDEDVLNRELTAILEKLNFNLICLAGFMKILPAEIVRRFPNQILNIHPSLLPQFKGMGAIGQALSAGVSTTGCTLHFVTEAVDEGPILAQASINILPSDSLETLTARMHRLEHTVYVEELKKLATNLT